LTTVPPKALKIGDKKPELKAETHAPTTELPQHLSMAYQYGFNHLIYMYPPPPMPPFIPGYSLPYPSGSSHNYESHHPRYSYCHNNNMPSSDPPEEIEDVSQFSLISEWLQELDNGPHGADGHHFSQFVPFFQHHKYIRICDIADNLDASSLSAKCEGIADGTAQNIISYARADTKAIRRREAKKGKACLY
jgi:hypothetical protein